MNDEGIDEILNGMVGLMNAIKTDYHDENYAQAAAGATILVDIGTNLINFVNLQSISQIKQEFFEGVTDKIKQYEESAGAVERSGHYL